MNQKLSELLASVQSTAVQVSDVAVDAVYGAGRKAGELVDAARVQLRIVDRKAEVNLVLRELGEILYATHVGEPSDSEIMLAKLQEIDALKAEIAELENRLGRKSAHAICETCGAEVQENAAFCGECGEKQ